MICKEYLGSDRGECDKPAIWRVFLLLIEDYPQPTVVYKCARHVRKYLGRPRERLEEYEQ